jgi:hypothetical protein
MEYYIHTRHSGEGSERVDESAVPDQRKKLPQVFLGTCNCAPHTVPHPHLRGPLFCNPFRSPSALCVCSRHLTLPLSSLTPAHCGASPPVRWRGGAGRRWMKMPPLILRKKPPPLPTFCIYIAINFSNSSTTCQSYIAIYILYTHNRVYRRAVYKFIRVQ